jgi:hypothetical protein
MRSSLRDLLLLTAIAALALCGCSWGSSRTKKAPVFTLSEKREEAQSKLLTEIPLGTTMEDARKAFQTRGFHVFEGTSDKFTARLDRHKSGLVSTNWIVQVKGEKGIVQDMNVEVHYTGP